MKSGGDTEFQRGFTFCIENNSVYLCAFSVDIGVSSCFYNKVIGTSNPFLSAERYPA